MLTPFERRKHHRHEFAVMMKMEYTPHDPLRAKYVKVLLATSVFWVYAFYI